MSKHRAQRQRLYWWQRKRLIAYQLQAWRLQLQETIQDGKDLVAEIKARKHND